MIFPRRFNLSWKVVLAGGLTFIASQILHIPLIVALGSLMEKNTILINALMLGLLAGVFEETARYILFKFIIKKSRSWKEGVLIGPGQGGTEALIIGVLWRKLLPTCWFIAILIYPLWRASLRNNIIEQMFLFSGCTII
ncbi:MAG TPA: YhfC family glutamic-type intramembrane protease [Anaerolineales bacterium]|nr:YhfC family glutamic-type intramembrane protease [Anaerolineales bacterium]